MWKNILVVDWELGREDKEIKLQYENITAFLYWSVRYLFF